MSHEITLRPMTIDDYDAVYALWRVSPGVGLHPSDEREPIARYLERNPGLSTVAVEGERIVGAMLCGHDGRRGDFVHLAVAESHRGRGIGRRIVENCLEKLAAEGIRMCGLRLYTDNTAGAAFWDRMGFSPREDLVVMRRQQL